MLLFMSLRHLSVYELAHARVALPDFFTPQL